jgi:hypothetical protein
VKKPRTVIYDQGKVPEAVWGMIRDLARDRLTSTDGLIEDLKKRQKLVAFLSRSDQSLAGITTYDVVAEHFEGRKAVMIFSGNAWVHPDWRGQNLTTWYGFWTTVKVRLRYPFSRLYLFFGSSNYKSYLFLTRNLRTFWPRRDKATPGWESRYIQHLARQVYGAEICPDTLVWRQSVGRSFVREETSAGSGPVTDPDLVFYQKTNPGYVEGERLMCLAPLTVANVVAGLGSTLTRSFRRRKRP